MVNFTQFLKPALMGMFAITSMALAAEEGTYEYNAGSASGSATRYVTTLTIKDASNTVQVAGSGGSYNRAIYKDCTATVFETTAGAEVDIQCTSGAGEWMHSFFYVDYNKDYAFSVAYNDDYTPATGSELVSYNHCDPLASKLGNADDSRTWYNSTGQSWTQAGYAHNASIQTTMDTNSRMPAFTIPADLAPGDYRARYKVDWSYDDAAALNANRSNNFITSNQGSIIDFTIRIVEPAAIDDVIADADANAPVEYYNLQGIRLNEAPANGIVIRRQGTKVQKIAIR